MAQPIAKLERQPEARDRHAETEEMWNLYVEHKETIHETLRILKGLHDHGILPLLAGLVEQSDKVGQILVEEAAKPANTQALQNAVLLFQLAGSLDPRLLQELAEGFGRAGEAAVQELRHDRKRSLLDLWRMLRSEEVIRALSMILRFLRGLGSKSIPDGQRWETPR